MAMTTTIAVPTSYAARCTNLAELKVARQQLHGTSYPILPAGEPS